MALALPVPRRIPGRHLLPLSRICCRIAQCYLARTPHGSESQYCWAVLFGHLEARHQAHRSPFIIMNRLSLLIIAVLAVCSCVSAEFLAGAEPSRPNIVFIITDDQGYGDLGCHGNPVIKTPHIDTLAAESSQLADYHVAPTCSPTRAALLTGHWTDRTGVWHTVNGRSMLRENEVTLAHMLKDAGPAQVRTSRPLGGEGAHVRRICDQSPPLAGRGRSADHGPAAARRRCARRIKSLSRSCRRRHSRRGCRPANRRPRSGNQTSRARRSRNNFHCHPDRRLSPACPHLR